MDRAARLRVAVAEDQRLHVAGHARAADWLGSGGRRGRRRSGSARRAWPWESASCGVVGRGRHHRHERRLGPGVVNGVGVWKTEVGMGVISGVGVGWPRQSAGRMAAAWKSDQRSPTFVPAAGGGGRTAREQRHGTNGEQQASKKHGAEREQALTATAGWFCDVSSSIRDAGAATGRGREPKTTLRAIRRVFRVARSAVRTVQTVTLCRTSTEYRFDVSRPSLQSVSSG